MGKWKEIELNELCQIIGGGTPSKQNKNFYNGDIPWASVRDMNSEIINKTEFKITGDAVTNSSTNIIEKGSIIIATRVGLGKVCYAGTDLAINQDLKGILINDNIINSYLFFYFKNIAQFLIDSGTGATVKGVRLNLIKNLKIPLPPLPEQKRIVAKLDGLFEKIDQGIRLLEENIAHTQALMGSVLDEEFNIRKNIKYIKASEIGKVIRGSSPRPKGDLRYYGGKVPRLMVADVTRDGMYVTPKIDFLTEKGKLKSRPCPKGTLTIQVSGNPGTPSILNVDACIHDGFAAIININEDVWSKRFLYHYLILKKLEYGSLAKGATFKNIKTDIIRDFDVPLMEKSIQGKISDNIEKKNKTIQLLVETQTQRLNHLKALKSSLLDQAFKGEL